MIDFFCWPTTDSLEILLCLEEARLQYCIRPAGPNNENPINSNYLASMAVEKFAVIVDNDPCDNGDPITVLGSAAILLYLAEKSGKLIPTDLREKKNVTEWLFFKDKNPNLFNLESNHETYSLNAGGRRIDNMKELYKIIDSLLEKHPYIAGNEYSVADISVYSWVISLQNDEKKVKSLPNLNRWIQLVNSRTATSRAFNKTEIFNQQYRLPRHINRAIEYIHAHAREKITINDLATYSFTSIRNIQLGFKAHRNITPLQYLREVRLKSAREEILNENNRNTWQNIALSWGFSDACMFSKYYKDRFGETPFKTQYNIKGPLR